MRTLFSLGSKQLAHRKGRSALTAIGIVLGVAVLFGVLVSNATTQTGVDRLIADFTGSADVIVSPAGALDATMPESMVGRLERLPGVTAAVGSFRFRSSINTPAVDDPEEIVVRGIELASARRIQTYRLVSGRFFRSGEAEVVVPKRLAATLGLQAGEAVKVQTPFGLRPVRLVGILTDTGAGRTDQGDVAFTSLAEARSLARVGAVSSGARIALDDGTDVETWIDRHQNDLGPGLDFENAGELARGFKDFLAVLGAVFTFFAAITLFVGAFLIYLTLSMAVIERVRVYGTMRALGATRAQVRRIVMAEALALGTASTVVGLLFGLLIAKGLLVLVAGLFEIDLTGLTIRPPAVLAGIAIGIVTTLISSLIPARRAARLSPVVAMKGDYASETRLSRAWIAGAVLAAFGIATGLAGGGTGSLGTPLILLGSVLLVPLLLRPLARVLGRVTNRMARGVGDVAVLHLVKERSRSAYTLALIMVVMAMIFSIGGMQASVIRALDDSLDRQFGSDLQIDASGILDPSFERELRAVPGVGAVTPIRFAALLYFDDRGERKEAFARIIDPATYFDVESFQFARGSEAEARAALSRGGGVLLPEIQAAEIGKKRGDLLRLNTSRGPHDFRIVATYVTFAAGPPEVIVGMPDARRYFLAGGASGFHLNVAPGADVAIVRAAIEGGLGQRYNLDVQTALSLKQEARTEIGRFFNIFYAILFVAAIVGLLGLANTLAMSVLQRYREIGVLRAIGTTRGQVRRMVLVESSTLGLVAFALSLPLGWLLSILVLGGMEDAFGFDVPYVYPAGWVPVVAAFGILVAALAAFAPGRRAARLEVVTALQYE